MASKLLLMTVFIFDLIAFALAIAGERRRSTVCRGESESIHVKSQHLCFLMGCTANVAENFQWFNKHENARQCLPNIVTFMFSRLYIIKSFLMNFKNCQHLVLQAVVKQDSQIKYSYCVYDSDIATGFGVGAFLFLMASQVLIMVASKCFCCGKPLRPGGSRALAVRLFITCWVLFFIAESCLLAGAVRNAYRTRYRTVFSDTPNCETLRKGIFAAGAAFTLFTAIVSEFYYVCYSKARDNFEPYGRETGVEMRAYK